MVRGMFKFEECSSVEEFGQYIAGLRPNQALSYGIPKERSMGMVVTRAENGALPVDQRDDRIARVNEQFEWPAGPGIFMIDIDPPKNAPAPSKGKTVALIRGIAPELNDVPMLWYPSSSSLIYTADGAEMSGLRGHGSAAYTAAG